MTKEEIIVKLKELKATGFSYQGIAQQTGLKVQDIYDFMRRPAPRMRVHIALEEYFTRGVK